jgi:membrane-associated protease RseP (regulator of RpoE activity)
MVMTAVLVVSTTESFAQEPACTCPVHGSKHPKARSKKNEKAPTGFQGFGLGYHLGYGYGGTELGFGHGPYALGVGPEGGYPYYGGPGYPHPDPVLSRKLPIVPFCDFVGPGYPSPDHPNFFGPTGPLVDDKPVVTFTPDPNVPIQEIGYGQFNGALAYPESTFAPFATMIGEYGLSGPGATPSANAPPASESLGMNFTPFSEAGLTPGLKITNVVPSGVAAKAGLNVGDVIVAINGYVTQKLTDPEWIILNASPNKVLKIVVRFAGDGKDHEVTAQLP